MRKTQFFAAFCGALFLVDTVASVTSAQQGQAPAGGGIAVIDIGKIFEAYPRFQQQKEALKAEVQQAEASMKAEADALQSSLEQLKEFKPGTPQYKQLEEQIASKRANMNVAVQLQRKDFLQKEAGMYHQAYREVQDQVQMIASRYGIVAVFRINSEKVDQDQPEQILRNIQKTLVWHHPNLDITQLVLQNLAKRAGAQVGVQGQPSVRGNTGIPGPSTRR